MITDYLDSALGESTFHMTSKGEQYSYDCCFCDDRKQRLFVNLDRKVYYCHNCESSGTLVTLISEYASITWQEALSVYREYEGQETALPESIEEEIFSRLIKVPQIEVPKYIHPLPDEFILLEDAKGQSGREAINYIKDRGISLRTAEERYIGYCDEGKYAGRIIMPDFENGEIVHWQARTWKPTPKSKMARKMFRKVLNPSLTPEQLSDGVRAVEKSEVVGNIDSVIQSRMAVLVEGKFDEYTIPGIGACLHGKHMSDSQFMKLVRNKNNIDVIAVMMDGDAFSSAIVTADRLYRHFDDVLVCRLPKDADPNQLGSKKCLELIEGSIAYSPMFAVKAKMKGWA